MIFKIVLYKNKKLITYINKNDNVIISSYFLNKMYQIFQLIIRYRK